MPRATQIVNVSVVRDGTPGGKRCWNIKVEADAELFFLSDELAKEGLIKDMDKALRSANREAVTTYISSGREFIKGAAKNGKTKQEAK